MRLATTNACSWHPKADEINNIFGTSDMDILGITETWLTQKIPNSVLLPTAAFEIVRRDRPSHVALRGGGVAFLLRPGLAYVRRADLEPANTNLEILCIQLKNGHKDVYIFCCYRSPRQDHSTFLSGLRESISSITDTTASIIILGDSNARHNEWYRQDPNTAAGRCRVELLDDTGFTQLVRDRPTRFSAAGQSSSLLDLVLCNQPFLIHNLTTLPPVSDHCPVVFDLAIQTRCCCCVYLNSQTKRADLPNEKVANADRKQ